MLIRTYRESKGCNSYNFLNNRAAGIHSFSAIKEIYCRVFIPWNQRLYLASEYYNRDPVMLNYLIAGHATNEKKLRHSIPGRNGIN